jgi:hypothetical protein
VTKRKVQFRLLGSAIRFGATNPEEWTFPNLHHDNNLQAARMCHGYVWGANNLKAAAMLDALYYLVVECQSSELATRKLREIRAAHRQIQEEQRCLNSKT